VYVTDTQLLNDVPATIGFVPALVAAMSTRVVAAPRCTRGRSGRPHIDAIEQHLADIAEQSPAPAR
jgi:hypothetical protein